MSRQYFGSAAHFVGSESCRFHIATLVGDYVVSTVGDYRPSGFRFEPGSKVYGAEIGCGRRYETMVFRNGGPCGCGCGMPEIDGSEIDFEGYNTRGEANAGHERMCQKYEAVPRKRSARGKKASLSLIKKEKGL